jgi:hypothetical protein
LRTLIVYGDRYPFLPSVTHIILQRLPPPGIFGSSAAAAGAVTVSDRITFFFGPRHHSDWSRTAEDAVFKLGARINELHASGRKLGSISLVRSGQIGPSRMAIRESDIYQIHLIL